MREQKTFRVALRDALIVDGVLGFIGFITLARESAVLTLIALIGHAAMIGFAARRRANPGPDDLVLVTWGMFFCMFLASSAAQVWNRIAWANGWWWLIKMPPLL